MSNKFQLIKKDKSKSTNRINEDLKYDRELYLVREENGLQKITYNAAQKIADEHALDLVEISQKDNMPLCKLLNYDKFKYESKKNKPKQSKQTLKEIKISSSISKNDLEIKVKNARRFIERGDKVKLTLELRGRENANVEFHKKSLLEFIVMCEDFASMESAPKLEGKRCITILKTTKK